MFKGNGTYLALLSYPQKIIFFRCNLETYGTFSWEFENGFVDSIFELSFWCSKEYILTFHCFRNHRIQNTNSWYIYLESKKEKKRKTGDNLWKCCALFCIKESFFLRNYYITGRQALKKKEKPARVAQSVERVAFNHNVQGSSPCSGGCFFSFHLKNNDIII